MNTIKLAKSGIDLPLIGFGPDCLDYGLPRPGNTFIKKVHRKVCRFFFDEPMYQKAITSSFKIGFRLLDYSAAYGNGYFLQKALNQAKVKRSELLLTTRISNSAQYNNSIDEEINDQLKGFKTNYIDILMFHWPVTEHYEDTWLKMIELKKRGICKCLGVANCNIHHLQRLYEISGEYPEINQVEVHPLFSQVELREFCNEHGIIIESYSPTARHDDRLYNPRLLKEMSKRYNRSINQLILRWHIQNGLVPIIRSWNPEHLKSDYNIFDFELSKEDMDKINGLNINSRIRYDPDNCDFHSL